MWILQQCPTCLWCFLHQRVCGDADGRRAQTAVERTFIPNKQHTEDDKVLLCCFQELLFNVEYTHSWRLSQLS